MFVRGGVPDPRAHFVHSRLWQTSQSLLSFLLPSNFLLVLGVAAISTSNLLLNLLVESLSELVAILVYFGLNFGRLQQHVGSQLRYGPFRAAYCIF